MLTDFLADVVYWLVDGLLSVFDAVMPQALLDFLDSGSDTLSLLLLFTPATILLLLILTSEVLQTGLDGLGFISATYKLIPFKAS